MKSENWGLIDYESSVRKQTQYVEMIHEGVEEVIVLCQHPAVVTLGRGHVAEDIEGWSGKVYESTRGGRATYHGPNQAVLYPILNLQTEHKAFKPRDVHSYLRALEVATVSSLSELGLKNVEARTSKVGEISLTGVWVGEKKIASIGIAVRKWVTYHGVAINLLQDESAFKGIRPCGFSANIMTNLEAELDQKIDLEPTRQVIGEQFLRALR